MLDQVETAARTLPPPSPDVVRVIEAGLALPILDLAPFLAQAPGAAEQLAADVKLIQETLGFYKIVNHGVDTALIDALVEQARALFALPEEEKLKSKAQRHMQGYWPPNTVANYRPGFEDEEDKKSTIAGWVLTREHAPDDPKVLSGAPHRAVNQWPDPAKMPNFRPLMERYQGQMLDLAQKLVPIYARVLGLEPDHFAKDFVDPEWYTRCNHNRGGGGGMFVNAHSDHSFLTLLPISRVPGLQVRTPAHTWIDVTVDEGAIIVNTGEWLNRLSNGRLIATPHRVIQPETERISIPFFMDPNDEARDDPVPGALKPGEARKLPSTTFGEFFASYIDALRLPKPYA